jgi:hypothetical protein
MIPPAAVCCKPMLDRSLRDELTLHAKHAPAANNVATFKNLECSPLLEFRVRDTGFVERFDSRVRVRARENRRIGTIHESNTKEHTGSTDDAEMWSIRTRMVIAQVERRRTAS